MTLEKAYREVMDRVVVTEEMHRRILERVQQPGPTAAQRRMGRRLLAAACLLVVLAGAALLPQLRTMPENPSGVQNVLLQRTEAASLEELSQIVGFPVEDVTDLPFAVTEVQYMAYPGPMAEVTYRGGEACLQFRKTVGDTDPSGDYTVYEAEETITAGAWTVTLKGTAGEYVLAVWQDGTYACSLRSDTVLSREQWSEVLTSLGDRS